MDRMVATLSFSRPNLTRIAPDHRLEVEAWQSADDEGVWHEAGRVYVVFRGRRREVGFVGDEWQEIRTFVHSSMREERSAADYLWGRA